MVRICHGRVLRGGSSVDCIFVDVCHYGFKYNAAVDEGLTSCGVPFGETTSLQGLKLIVEAAMAVGKNGGLALAVLFVEDKIDKIRSSLSTVPT